MQSPKMPGTLSFIQVRIIKYPHLSVVKNSSKGETGTIMMKTKSCSKTLTRFKYTWKTD